MGIGRRRVLALVGAASLAAMGIVGAFGTALASADDAKADPATLPKSIHGAVETKAFTFGSVAPSIVPAVGSVLLDPGPAYAYSTLDRDDYGENNVNFTMTARGANLDPGAIGGAAAWAPANCDDPNAQLPCLLRNPTDPIANQKRKSGGAPEQGDVGLHNAAGWPAYAEALFPDQPGQPSQQTVYKCVVNKDANGAQPTTGQAQTICKQGGDSVPLTAWAEAIGDQIRSEGFSRAEGFSSPGMFSVGASESHSLVKPEAGGVLHSAAYSTINSIDIGGGQIRIDQVRSEGDIKATTDKVVSATGSCTLSGLTVAGQPVQQTTGGELPVQQLQPLLDQVQAATQLKVEIDPPTGVENITVEGVKHVVDCAGLHISITDLRTDTGVCSPVPPPPPPDPHIPPSPQCVPPSGVRYEISFGKLSVQESVNAFPAGGFDTGGLTTSVEGTELGAPAAAPDLGAGASTETPSIGAPLAPTGGTGTFRSGGPVRNASGGPGFKFLKANLATIAAWTTASAAAIALVVWLLLGVVNSISQGTRLRLPGL